MPTSSSLWPCCRGNSTMHLWNVIPAPLTVDLSTLSFPHRRSPERFRPQDKSGRLFQPNVSLVSILISRRCMWTSSSTGGHPMYRRSCRRSSTHLRLQLQLMEISNNNTSSALAHSAASALELRMATCPLTRVACETHAQARISA